MTTYILVLREDADADQWVYVAEADSAAALEALECFGGNAASYLPKAGNPGEWITSITGYNCAIPEKPETGDIYALN